jgi:hypothetical protein
VDVSGGVSSTSSAERTLSGTGWFLIEPTASDHAIVDFACRAAAGPDASVIRFFATDGCVLYQGTSAIATAPGLTVGAPVAGTSGRTVVSLSQGGLSVCWHVQALFTDGEELSTTGCADSLQPTSDDFPQETNRTIRGFGGRAFDGLATAYYCAAVATPDAVTTEVVSCGLDDGTTAYSTGGVVAPGPAALTAGIAFTAGEDPGSVCWTVRATFVSGEEFTATDCSSG